MPDYQNGKVYTSRCRTDDALIYVGSTTMTLAKRWGGHKIASRQIKQQDRLIYKTINNNYENWYIELYEEYPCENKEQLNKREGEIIREIGTLNSQIAGRTIQEWRDDNIDKVKLARKEYLENNVEKIKKYYNNTFEKRRLTQKLYYEDNVEKLKLAKQEYYENNIDKLKLKDRVYYEKNKDEILGKKKQYYENNAEKIKKYKQEYRAKQKAKKEGVII